MNYTFNFRNTVENSERLSLSRFGVLFEFFNKVSQLSYENIMYGINPSKRPRFKQLPIELESFNKGILVVYSDTLDKYYKHQELHMFSEQLQEKLKSFTPISLALETFDAIKQNREEFISKPIIKEVKKVSNLFSLDTEILVCKNQGSFEMEITQNDVKEIGLIEDTIPEPYRIIHTGMLDTMMKSKNRCVIIGQDNKSVMATVLDPNVESQLPNFWGKYVTVEGLVHYKSQTNRIIEIERISETSEEHLDRTTLYELFDEKPVVKPKVISINPLEEFAGIWDDVDFSTIQ